VEADPISSRGDLDRCVASGGDLCIDVADPGSAVSVAFSRTIEAVLARRHPAVRLARAELPVAAPVASLFGISEAPALVVFRAGVGLYAGPAILGEAQLEAMLNRALSLDMDEVRREMDRNRPEMARAAGVRACPTSGRGLQSTG